MTEVQKESDDLIQRTLIKKIRDRIGLLKKLKGEMQRIADKRAAPPSDKDFQTADAQKTSETKELEGDIRELADFLIANAYVTAARGDNFTLFYDTAPLFTQAIEDLKKQADAVTSISRVSISNPDAVKEINRLLDHTSVKRIAEEMDVTNYHAQATRLFDRIRAEFKEEQDMLKDVPAATSPGTSGKTKAPATAEDEKKPSLIEYVEKTNRNIKSFTALVDPLWADASLLSAPLPEDLRDQIKIAEKFFTHYGKFLEYSDASAELMKSDFGSEGSTEAYLDVTERHARRIEKEGLFASWKTIGMGVVAGLCVAATLLFFDNNLALKNWALQWALAAAVLMYMASILFGKLARAGHMRDLRNMLHTHISNVFSAGSKPLTKERQDSSFKFPKLPWNAFHSGMQLKGKLPQAGALAEELETNSNRAWIHHESRMWMGNATVFAAIVALPLLASNAFHTLDYTKKFEFVSAGNGQGTCLLETGRVLLATGDSYFVTGNDEHVTEIAKSSVFMIRPKGEQASGLPDCVASRPTGSPAPISLAKPLDEAQSLGAAADKISGALEKGMSLIADKLPRGGGACRNDCPRPEPPQSSSYQTIVVPILVETTQSAALPDIIQEGPIFTTQIHNTDGTVRDIGGRNLVLLPLFADPVTGRNDKSYQADGVNRPAEAFHFGLARMKDPVPPGHEETLVQRIGTAFKRCMSATKTAYDKANLPTPKLTLFVRGYASEEWTGPIAADTSKAELNWYLAEGRRLAVIDALGIRGNDLIEIKADRPDMKLETLAGISRKTLLGDIEAKRRDNGLESGFQFTQEGMPDALRTWLKQIIGDDQPDQGEMRVLARSVVITVEGDTLAHCGEIHEPEIQKSEVN